MALAGAFLWESTLRGLLLANGNVFSLASTEAVNDGQWHHVVLTHGNTTTKLYLNGNVVASVDVPGSGAAGNQALTIGGTGSPTVDEVMLFARELTADEVTHLPPTEYDHDGDGLSALMEQSAGTEPFVSDTDGDGLSDGEEISTYASNPLNTDSDGDGVADGAEDAAGTSLTMAPYTAVENAFYFEAENFHLQTPGTGVAESLIWGEQQAAQASGGTYLLVDDNGVNTLEELTGPRLDYELLFPEAGLYQIWVRARAHGGTNDSLHVGLNGVPASLGGLGLSTYGTSQFEWRNRIGNGGVINLSVPSAGLHKVNVWMREDGIDLDALSLGLLAPPAGTPRSFEGDVLALEAEDFDFLQPGVATGYGRTWEIVPDASALEGLMTTAPESPGEEVNTLLTSHGARMDYAVEFPTAGTYYVWVRGRASEGTDDSILIGLNGQISTGEGWGLSGFNNPAGEYLWSNSILTTGGSLRAMVNVPSAGSHTFSAWMREDGTVIDTFLLTQDPNFQPIDSAIEMPGFALREYWMSLPGGHIADLTGVAAYPETPHGRAFIDELKIENFSESLYGQRIRGYVIAPETGEYVFRISGDARAEFWFGDVGRIAWLTNSTRKGQFDKKPSQTSAVQFLEAGGRYPFEILHKAIDKGHVSVAWIKPDGTQEIIGGPSLAMRGSSLDEDLDGLSNFEELLNQTSATLADVDGDGLNDRLELELNLDPGVADTDGDGFTDGQGLAGYVERKDWYEIGSDEFLRSLEEEARYPTVPDLHKYEPGLYSGDVNWNANFGTRLRAVLEAPETGEYIFGIAGNGESKLYLGTNESKFSAREIASVRTWSYFGEITREEKQISDPVTLQAGQKYYIEAVMKEGTGRDVLAVYWQPPGGEVEPVARQFLTSFKTEPADLDDDELEDSWELANSLSTTDDGFNDLGNGPAGGPDGDRLIHRFEGEGGTNPEIADSDGDGTDDFYEVLLGGDLSATPVLNPLPEEWMVKSYGDATIAEAFSLGADTFTLLADGSGVATEGEGVVMITQTVRGDFSMSVKPHATARVFSGTQFSIIARDPAGNSAPLFGVRFTTRSNFAVLQRTTEEAIGELIAVKFDQFRFMDYSIKLERIGNQLIASYSEDDFNWIELGRTQDFLPDEVDLGMGLSSGPDNPSSLVAFEDISFWADGDRDGATDAQEVAAGTNPLTADTDGDGFSDYEEIFHLFSNPLVADLGSLTTVANFDGKDATVASGEWGDHPQGIYNTGTRGELTYTFTAPEDGVYRIEVDGNSFSNSTNDPQFDFWVSVDGDYIQTLRFLSDDDQPVLGVVYTPWIKAGEHTVSLFLDNVEFRRSFIINSVTVSSLSGSDSDVDGQIDWMTTRLENLNTVYNGTAQSAVSPYNLQGSARYFDLLNIDADGDDLAPRHGVGEDWDADIPLEAAAPTSATISFEEGGLVEQLSIDWTLTDLLASPADMVLRVGDSLLLTASEAGSGTINVLKDGAAEPETLTSQFGTPVPYEFTEAGTFTIDGQSVEGTLGSMTVTVLGGGFAGSPIIPAGTFEIWENPELPDAAAVESDAAMHFEELLPPPVQGRSFEAALDSARHRYTVARAGSAVLSAQQIRSLRVNTAEQTAVESRQLADGTHAIDMHLVVSDLSPDYEIILVIFKPGVMFDDGTTYKVLTAADFGPDGELILTFIKPGSLVNTICHFMTIRQISE